jgi:hypothetical protein
MPQSLPRPGGTSGTAGRSLGARQMNPPPNRRASRTASCGTARVNDELQPTDLVSDDVRRRLERPDPSRA